MRFSKPEPFWLTLIPPAAGDEEAPNGVRAKFAPMTRAMRRRAARAARAAAGELPDPGAELTPEMEDALYAAGEVSSAMLIRLGLIECKVPEWEGVLDQDGAPLPLTEDTVDIVLANEEFLEAAERAYLLPIFERDAEKNGYSASPNGTGEAGTPASDIASSSADTIQRTAPPSDATAAPTVRTPSRPRKPRASGKS